MTGAPQRPADPDWLALRAPADTRARDAAAGALLPPLLERLGRTGDLPTASDLALRIVDLGAGTGANLRWLAPRLPHPDRQHWMLVDQDPGLLARGPGQATAVKADVADLGRLLPEFGGADLITASALLDVLYPDQLAAIIDAIVDARVPALFSLSVTGEVVLDPAEPLDGPLAAAFDAHQRRDGRLGPDAGGHAMRLFRDRGWSVLEVRTPWLLSAANGDAELIDAWLDGRVEAAVEHQPDLASEAAAWLVRRRATPSAPGPEAVVGHTDLLALPT
jgi:SAM-dependent methyltransferase